MSTSDVDGICEHLDVCKLGKISDEELFKQPPPLHEDCPICFLSMPSLNTGSKYKACCGKMICSGCIYAPRYDDQGYKVDNKICPFCRTPTPTTEEGIVERINKLMDAGDAIAIHSRGCDYRYATYGFTQDYAKALELWHRAGELGYAEAYHGIGYAYDSGEGVEVDKKKARHYYELAAVEGSVLARYNLGNIELHSGNFDLALKHFMIALRSGEMDSLDTIKEMYRNDDATKEDYMKALRLYQEYLGEIKSKQRDEAAAYNSELYQYY